MGEAKRRGTFEERRKQAIIEGRIKMAQRYLVSKTTSTNLDKIHLDRILPPAIGRLILFGPRPGSLRAFIKNNKSLAR